MIQFVQVSKKYQHVDDFSLKDISFKVEEGEFVFLIGPSGSGKTTLMRMLIREEKPTEGKIFFDDYDITKINRGQVYKLRRLVGVVFQDYKLVAHKNVYENVAFAMEVAGQKKDAIKETVPYVLDIVGLGHKEKSFPNQLSGGEQQRVAIARAMANSPRVLIADEPTGNLDPASAWDIVQILSKINSFGTTVIMSTHGTDIVNSLNKRVIQLEGGMIMRDDSKGQYEFTRDSFSESILESSDQQEEVQPKTVIKVNLRTDKIRTKLKQRQEERKVEPQEGPEILETSSVEDVKEVVEQKEKLEINAEEEILKHPETNSEQGKSESKFPFMNLLKWNKEEPKKTEEPKVEVKEDKEPVKPIVNVGLAGNRDKIKAELDKATIEEDMEKLAKNTTKQIEKDAKQIAVDLLDLDQNLITDLKGAGYLFVSDIIAAGPDKLAEDKVIDPIEVIEVSQAIGEFIDIELEQLERNNTKPTKTKSTKVKKKNKK